MYYTSLCGPVTVVAQASILVWDWMLFWDSQNSWEAKGIDVCGSDAGQEDLRRKIDDVSEAIRTSVIGLRSCRAIRLRRFAPSRE